MHALRTCKVASCLLAGHANGSHLRTLLGAEIQAALQFANHMHRTILRPRECAKHLVFRPPSRFAQHVSARYLMAVQIVRKNYAAEVVGTVRSFGPCCKVNMPWMACECVCVCVCLCSLARALMFLPKRTGICAW